MLFALECGKGENYPLELGSNSFIPGFEEQVAGHKAGEEFDVNVTFPEQYEPSLAGKDAVLKCKINEIKAKELPELSKVKLNDKEAIDSLKNKIALLKISLVATLNMSIFLGIIKISFA